MSALFGPQTAVIVQEKARKDEWIEVLSMQALYSKGPNNYRVWSPSGWTDIKLMSKMDQQSARLQWMQSRENLVVGHAAGMQVLCDPKCRTELQLVLDAALLPPLIAVIWEYARASWLLGSSPDEWFRCPLPRTTRPSRIPDDEPLVLVCHDCIESHGFKYHKVVIEDDVYYVDSVTGHRFCEYHAIEDDAARLRLLAQTPIESDACRSDPTVHGRRQNWNVTQADVLNHPAPARYLDAWKHYTGRPWPYSCWEPADVQADVIIVAHAGRAHSISDGPESHPVEKFHESTERLAPDVLTRWDHGSWYPFQKAIFSPEHCYGLQTESGSFCAGIGFWAFAC